MKDMTANTKSVANVVIMHNMDSTAYVLLQVLEREKEPRIIATKYNLTETEDSSSFNGIIQAIGARRYFAGSFYQKAKDRTYREFGIAYNLEDDCDVKELEKVAHAAGY